jgi:hypothetical protein
LPEVEEQEAKVMRSPHQPRIVQRAGEYWVVECQECLEDHTASVPIGIGLPLPDRLTAERLVENHRGREVAVR